METNNRSSLEAIKKQCELQVSAMRDHVQEVESEIVELQHKYQDSLQNVRTLELEKKEMQKEMDSLREEVREMKDHSAELRDVVADLKMKEKLVFQPAVSDLERTHHKTTDLQSQLTQQQQHTKQLSTRLSHSMEENQRYRDALEHNDVALRRKEESSKHALNALNQQIEALQSENEELKKELVRSELNMARIHQNRRGVEEEKALDLDSMNEIQFDRRNETVKIANEWNEGGMSDSEDSLSDLETFDKCSRGNSRANSRVNSRANSRRSSLVDTDIAIVNGKKNPRRSIMMSIQDLASILRRDSIGNDHDYLCSRLNDSFFGDGEGHGHHDENTVSMEEFNNLQKDYDSLRNKLERREKRIDNLCDTIASMKVKEGNKKAYGWLPWCG